MEDETQIIPEPIARPTEKSIELREPIEFGGRTYTSLELREPKAGELEKASLAATSAGTIISLIASMMNCPRKVIEQVPSTEFNEASDFLGSFGSRPTTSGPGTE